jgi:hypothetical protein
MAGVPCKSCAGLVRGLPYFLLYPKGSIIIGRSIRTTTFIKGTRLKSIWRLALNREQYLEYVDHFNNKRYDKVTSYFAPDITVEYFDNAYGPQIPARTLYGPQEFTASYKSLHEHTREVLELRDFMVDGDLVFAELYTEFHTFKDTPASTAGWQKKKGDVSIMTNWVIYTMEGSKMKRIRIAHSRNHDPKTARFLNKVI